MELLDTDANAYAKGGESLPVFKGKHYENTPMQYTEIFFGCKK